MRDRLPFSHLLPLIDLALLIILVFVPITMTALHLYSASKSADPVHLHLGEYEMTVPQSQIIPWSIRIATGRRARTMIAINIPGELIQLLISIPSVASGAQGWHPHALTLQTWLALAFPFFALPFWWLVGCGLDGLVYKERLHWALRVIGTICFAYCLAIVFGYFFFRMPAVDRADLAPVRGAIAWTIGFATLPAAWITQSIRQRRSTNP